MLLQDNIRNVISVAGLLPAFVESIDDADELEILYTKFEGLTKESHSLSKAFTNEIIDIGPLLTGREELLRLLTSINGFVSNLEDICDIITNSKDIKKIKPNYTDELLEISNQIVISITKIREVVFLLSSTPGDIFNLTHEILENTTETEKILRSFVLVVISSKLSHKDMLLLNTINDRFLSIIVNIKSLVTNIRIILL